MGRVDFLFIYLFTLLLFLFLFYIFYLFFSLCSFGHVPRSQAVRCCRRSQMGALPLSENVVA